MHWDKTLLWIRHIFKSLTASLLVAIFLVSCGGKEPVDPTPNPGPGPDPKPPVETKDTKAPTITVKITEKNVIAWVVVSVKDNQLLFDQDVAATWTDDISKSCKVEMSLVPDGGQSKTINSGDKLEEAGTLQIKVLDEAGNSSSAEIKLTLSDTKAPDITLVIQEKNVVAGVKVAIQDNQLLFDQDIAASWKDDYSETFTTELYLFVDGCEPETVNIGDVITKAGVFKIHVTDEFGNKSIAEITLLSVAITGLENLQNLSLQVDKEVNLLHGLSIAEGLSLVKVEIEQDGTRSVIPDATKYIPKVPGTINIILTLSRTDGSTIEVKVDNLTIQGIQYQSVSITDIEPVDIFPQIAQIEAGDPNIYSYIEDLRVAEVYVMREMMSKYGGGNYSPEEYQQLLSRVIIGLLEEKPDDYENYEWIWPAYKPNTDDHSNCTFKNLISLSWIHTNIMNLSGAGEGWGKNLSDYALSHPNEILISSCSATPTADSQSGFLQSVFDQSIIDLCDLPNVILFIAWGDTKTVDGVDLKVIYNGFYDEIYGDWRYMYSSMANSDKNNYPNSNMRIVVWTNPQWNPDMTNSSWSLFPIGFSNNIMVSGRPVLPIYRKWRYWGEDYPKNWSYNTSYVTPAIASEAQLMFGLHADVKDADMLLLMIESSLTAPDYISLNGQRQALPKYSPANFAKKYCMTTTIPSSIGQGETVTLTKEWYKGLIFAIPGAEVQVNGEWIPFTAENASQIKAANPMHLEWRLNGALLRKYGYSSGQIIQGQIITVDDQWNGLRLEVPVSITIR